MKRKLTTIILGVFAISGLNAMATQTDTIAKIRSKKDDTSIKVSFGEKGGELKISGYLQAQWQMAQQEGIPALTAGGNFAPNSDNRFMVRRGRIKLTYDLSVMQVVFQPDFTEKGVAIKDAYIKVTAPSQIIGGQIGVFDRPFGYEISYSSSRRESPERSRVFLSLFPGERGVGAMAIMKGKKGTFMNRFTLNAGLFNGNGIGPETDSRKDFIGRLAYLHKHETGHWGVSTSYYGGGVLNPTENNFTYVKNQGFEQNEGVKGDYAKRHYVGVGAQVSQEWGAGKTHIRAEYVWGQQPGIENRNANPGGTSFGVGRNPLYLRNFRGSYVYLIQDIGRSKHSVVLKYDNYDPNTKVNPSEIGKLQGTGAADVAYNTYGVGYQFRWNKHLTLTAYYDMVSNEKCSNLGSSSPLADYARNIKDNVLTIRFQAKF